jgi:hypothetical protein
MIFEPEEPKIFVMSPDNRKGRASLKSLDSFQKTPTLEIEEVDLPESDYPYTR